MSDIRKIPDDVLKDIQRFLSSNDNSARRLTKTTLEWISQHPYFSIERPKTLYRGLFFKKRTPDSDDPGVAFLDKTKFGGMLPYTQKRLSSWTSILGVARSFALNSNEFPTFNGLRDRFLRKEDPALAPTGIVLSAFVTPQEVLLNVERFARLYGHGKFGREWEYILNPVRQLECKVVNIYTFDTLRKHKAGV